ncbi:hypothetical protein [Nocardia wallacei]|uniref:hypothetical protein n=1 Tax=Nocardia wallacei TaxID=480035 RepID=UPI0024589D51|nr:hypothetical protein [Nocardia wallacei]
MHSEYTDFRPARGGGERTLLNEISAAFDHLAGEPVPAGSPLAPGSSAVSSWGDLREHLWSPSLAAGEIDVVWGWLIERARQAWDWRGGQVVLACTGLALPMLAGVTGRFTEFGSVDRADAEAEIVAGFVRQLREIDLDLLKLWSRLWSATMHAGRSWSRQQAAAPAVLGVDHDPADVYPPLARTPHGHPELLLADAVAEGVITADAAELIALTRWEARSMNEVADQRRGVHSHWKVRKQRQRAEITLVPWLAARIADPHPDSLRDAAPPSDAPVAGPPADDPEALATTTEPTASINGCAQHTSAPPAPASGEEEARRCA